MRHRMIPHRELVMNFANGQSFLYSAHLLGIPLRGAQFRMESAGVLSCTLTPSRCCVADQLSNRSYFA